jgi:hypothetical protein
MGDLAAGAYALLFVAAVLGKLDSWDQWARLTREVPGPRALGVCVRFGVPAVESATVVLSLVRPTAGLAVGAIVLACLALGVWLLTRRLTGRECNCFGTIAPATISPRLAVRNAVLACAAAAGWYVSGRSHAHALSLEEVLATLLFGAIALMLVKFRRLRWSARTATRITATSNTASITSPAASSRWENSLSTG